MGIKNIFRIWTVLLLLVMALLSWFVFRHGSYLLFALCEVLVLAACVCLSVFYRRIIKPMQIIGDGMDLLKEQDFSSRLKTVGQPEADRIVEIFNRMMEQLRSERLHIRQQNHLLDLLIHASPQGVVMLNLDGKISSVNPSALEMFGLDTPQKVQGGTLAGIGSPLARELARIPLATSRSIRLGDATVYKCTHSSFIDRGYRHAFYLIESLTEEVFKAEKKAYEKVIRMIAHEVNNTTAGITSILDTLDSAFRHTAGTEDVPAILQVAIERCYRMSRFITGLADVVRIPEPQLRRQDLNALVFSTKEFMENLCLNRNIRIRIEPDEVSPEVFLDGILFEQVLLNIIKNSVEAIGRDGEIIIRTSACPASLEIADTGKGIDRETETKLFSPFFSTKPGGQGLGLIFVREVLLAHGFSFSLGTDPDGLTRFKIQCRESPGIIRPPKSDWN
jgi:nitrogen fixation/metabolism regulation signal transduction histidine kinase